MAVLWRSNEIAPGTAPDARYWPNGTPAPKVSGAAKNTFLEKHLRIFGETLPSEDKMKQVVKQVYDDRQKGPKTKVQSVTGPSDKTKQQLYGGLKPSVNSTYFINLAGFQETNSWIEKYITASNAHAEVPILGGGVVVTYDDKSASYSVVKVGKIRLSVAVGKDSPMSGNLTIQSKVVYHWGGLVTP